MLFVWTTVKVILGLAIAIPLAVIVLAVSLGVLGALVGLAVLALKVAFFALVAVVLLRFVSRLLWGSPAPRPAPTRRAALPPAAPPADPHYEAAMRELEEALGERPRR